jgi:hypothetical protein
VVMALQYIHEHSIRHADLGGRNLALNPSRTILLCDFAGSAIDGEPCTGWAESGFKHLHNEENEQITIRTELHALGLMVYELITSLSPHGEVKMDE